MLFAHAATLADARSYVAALADLAHTFDASVAYERVLLQLDRMQGDHLPGISPVQARDRDVVLSIAETAIENLARHGADALQVELVLDMLHAARERDSS